MFGRRVMPGPFAFADEVGRQRAIESRREVRPDRQRCCCVVEEEEFRPAEHRPHHLADNGWDAALGYAGKRAKLSPYEPGIRTPMSNASTSKATPASSPTLRCRGLTKCDA